MPQPSAMRIKKILMILAVSRIAFLGLFVSGIQSIPFPQEIVPAVGPTLGLPAGARGPNDVGTVGTVGSAATFAGVTLPQVPVGPSNDPITGAGIPAPGFGGNTNTPSAPPAPVPVSPPPIDPQPPVQPPPPPVQPPADTNTVNQPSVIPTPTDPTPTNQPSVVSSPTSPDSSSPSSQDFSGLGVDGFVGLIWALCTVVIGTIVAYFYFSRKNRKIKDGESNESPSSAIEYSGYPATQSPPETMSKPSTDPVSVENHSVVPKSPELIKNKPMDESALKGSALGLGVAMAGIVAVAASSEKSPTKSNKGLTSPVSQDSTEVIIATERRPSQKSTESNNSESKKDMVVSNEQRPSAGSIHSAHSKHSNISAEHSTVSNGSDNSATSKGSKRSFDQMNQKHEIVSPKSNSVLFGAVATGVVAGVALNQKTEQYSESNTDTVHNELEDINTKPVDVIAPNHVKNMVSNFETGKNKSENIETKTSNVQESTSISGIPLVNAMLDYSDSPEPEKFVTEVSPPLSAKKSPIDNENEEHRTASLHVSPIEDFDAIEGDHHDESETNSMTLPPTPQFEEGQDVIDTAPVSPTEMEPTIEIAEHNISPIRVSEISTFSNIDESSPINQEDIFEEKNSSSSDEETDQVMFDDFESLDNRPSSLFINSSQLAHLQQTSEQKSILSNMSNSSVGAQEDKSVPFKNLRSSVIIDEDVKNEDRFNNLRSSVIIEEVEDAGDNAEDEGDNESVDYQLDVQEDEVIEDVGDVTVRPLSIEVFDQDENLSDNESTTVLDESFPPLETDKYVNYLKERKSKSDIHD